MKEITGNIWDYHEKGHWIVITTNGNVKANGEAVMGKGIALQAKQRYPDIPKELGEAITNVGNAVYACEGHRIVCFPTKHNWWEKASLELIEESYKQLVQFVSVMVLEGIYLVRPGCSNGQLDWKDVKPILEKYLDDRFVVVERR